MNNVAKEIFSKIKLDWIADRTIYLCVAGSRAYGTNSESSDYDYRGVCIPPIEYLFGYHKRFEQTQLKDPDLTIFDIKKFFKLASDNNPNCLELLFVNPEDIVYMTKLGEKLIENRFLFLSKKVRQTMKGYAFGQLKDMQRHINWIKKPILGYPTRAELGLPDRMLLPENQLLAAEASIKKEMDKFSFDFLQDLEEYQKIEIRDIMSSMLAELKISKEDLWLASAKKIGLNDNLIEAMQKERAYISKKSEFDSYQEWKKSRNPERAAMEEKFGLDLKAASHLVRLVEQCKEILLTGNFSVKSKMKDKLIAIRRGSMNYEQIIEYFEREVKVIDEIYKTSSLQEVADDSKLQELCISIIGESFK